MPCLSSALTSAPCSSTTAALAAFPLTQHAQSSGVRWFSSRIPSIIGGFIRGGRPSIISLAISAWRCMQARCRGVLPSSCCVTTCQLLLPAISNAAISSNPWLAAQCSGVGPLSAGCARLPRALAFSSSSRRTSGVWPCITASRKTPRLTLSGSSRPAAMRAAFSFSACSFSAAATLAASSASASAFASASADASAAVASVAAASSTFVPAASWASSCVSAPSTGAAACASETACNLLAAVLTTRSARAAVNFALCAAVKAMSESSSTIISKSASSISSSCSISTPSSRQPGNSKS